MEALSTALIIFAAIVNLVPVSGVLSSGRLRALYGLEFDEPNLLILMRHRAVLFGIVGALLVVAAFHLPLRIVAIAAGLVSMLSFVMIAWVVGGYNAELRRIIVADLVASLALLGSVLIDYVSIG